MLDHALGLGVDDADQNGNAVVDDTDGLCDNLATALVGGEDDLARGAQEEQAIDAGIDHAVDAALKGGNVELGGLRYRERTTGGITPVNF